MDDFSFKFTESKRAQTQTTSCRTAESDRSGFESNPWPRVFPVSPPALVSFLHFIYQIKLKKGQTNYYLKKHYKTGATPGHNLITRHEGCITFPESSVYAPDQTETFNAD